MEMARAMLLKRDLPKSYWAEAVQYATYIKNRMPTRALNGMTPYEAMEKVKPDVGKLQPFGTECYILIQGETPSKIGAKSQKARFMGFSEESRAYRYILPGAKKVLTSRNVIFPYEGYTSTAEATTETSAPQAEGENEPASTNSSSDEQQPTPEVTPPVTTVPTTPPPNSATPQHDPLHLASPLTPVSSINLNLPAPPSTPTPQQTTHRQPLVLPNTRITRSNMQSSSIPAIYPMTGQNGRTRPANSPSNTRRPEAWQHHVPDESHLAEEEFTDYIFAATDAPISEPLDHIDAAKRPDAAEWDGAMRSEINSLESRRTYILTKLPPGRKAIESKWVYKLKMNPDGTIARYKARLVAKGFSQVPGLDYDRTHAPTLRLESFRLFLSIAASLDLELHGMDVVGAYLYGELEEEIYMKQPPGYSDGTARVCQLLKAIYGLKQSGRAWRTVLETELIKLGYTPLHFDRSLFIRAEKNGAISMLAIHVDDIAIAAPASIIEDIEKEIESVFDMNRLGHLNSMIGFQITRNREERTLHMSQAQYAMKIIARVGLSNANPSITPFDTHIKLTASNPDERDPDMADIPYHLAIGSLMYLAMGTRPDLTFAVQHLSQFSSNPSKEHWTAVKRVFRYIKGTSEFGITLGGINQNTRLLAYSDADWGGDLSHRKSVSGFVCIFGGPISWSSKKQQTVALSSMEAEYMALTHTIREVIWLRHLLSELSLTQKGPTEVLVDNQAALAYANSQDFHMRTKHIDIRHHFCREKIESGEIFTNYIHTSENVADLFTKGLSTPQHQALLRLLDLSPR